MKRRSRRRRHGYFAGLASATFLLTFLSFPELDRFHALGPANTGHEDLACVECHTKAPGTLRQQLQANAQHLVGLREESADIGSIPVDNQACLACHDRPDDHHPVFRFLEPRFEDARAALQPDQCLSCHTEHQGGRVNRPGDYCSQCHQDLEIQDDPVDVPHHRLVADARWDTCLRCHDYHGSHEWDAPETMADMIEADGLHRYLRGTGVTPYGTKAFQALQTRYPQ